MGNRHLMLVTGSRKWTAEDPLWKACEHFRLGMNIYDMIHVMHGACPTGLDKMFEDLCDSFVSITSLPIPAQWDMFNKQAGPKRNSAMVDMARVLSDYGWRVACYGFPLPDSKGTWDCMRKARASCIDTYVVGADGSVENFEVK